MKHFSDDTRNLDQDVKQNLDQARAITRVVREPMVVLDNKLRVLSGSKSFYNLFRLNKEETIGKEIFSSLSSKEMICAWWRVAPGKRMKI